MGKDYGSWSIAQLKDELRKRKAKVSGKKAALVQRLTDYDKLFGPLIADPESVYKITVPDPQHFRDVTSNSQIPVINADHLEIFCHLAEREDKSTSYNMYKEYFMMSCRIASVNSEYYLTGMVASEMRKNVTYNVTIKAIDHIILEAQCECAAGMGPYAQCKHVLVMIFAIIDMNENKTIKLRASTTSHLQTFHQPKKLHTGDPVKAEDLTLKFKDANYKEICMFDPRPTSESDEKYRENFKNAVINFCGQSKETSTMPMAQLVKPADKDTIFSDHDYLEKTNEEMFLESLNLNEEERCKLEEETRSNRKVWKKERMLRLQSSNFGKIIKTLTGAEKLAKSMVKNTEIFTAAIKHGLKYEEEATLKFEEITQLSTTRCGIIVHKDCPFLASTPDRLVGDDFVLEVKCPYTAKNKSVCPENVPYLYLCEKTGNIKLNEQHDYYYQVQGQLLCTGRKTAFFCVYTISDFKIIVVEKDTEFIENMFIKLNHFYEKYFKNVIINKFLYNKKV